MGMISGIGARGPSSTFAISRWLFVRALGLVYLFAFWSLAQQIRGLVGQHGMLPAHEYMAAAASWANGEGIGAARWYFLPTLFWIGTPDWFLVGVSVCGACLAALLVVGAAPALLLVFLWVCYLSLAVVCRDFLSYQWDALLLETGLLAILIAPIAWRDRVRRATDPPRLARWLLWGLLFRLMFGSGTVKLASGDPTWRGLTAMLFHYETQPLPTPLAWYAAQLPPWMHRGETLIVLIIELVVPWLVFGPRRVRTGAAAVMIALQVLIALTGNYAFFNLLTIALCLLLLDDGTLGPIAARFQREPHLEGARREYLPAWAIAAVACLTVSLLGAQLASRSGMRLPEAPIAARLITLLEPMRSVNQYGLFAVMTTTRPEIVVEGSDDGITWRPYEFFDKVGDVARRPPWVAPFQPRLDWQMWFAVLSQYEQEEWFQRFCVRLLEGSPSVQGLLAHDPFGGRPPRFVRGELYEYHFSDWATARAQRVWWVRQRIGPYSPVLSLR